jgi:lysozyme
MNVNLLRKILIRHEGVRLKPYLDTVKKLTIGVGRNLDDIGISPDEALYLLNQDIVRTATELGQKLPWIKQLSEIRQIALMSMAFNLGVDGLLKFKDMLAALKLGDYSSAAREMLDSRWRWQVKKRAAELAAMIEKEEIPADLR